MANVNSPNISIKVEFFRGSQDGYSVYEIAPREETIGEEYTSLNEIILNEDMFAQTVYGHVVFTDSSNIVDQLNLSPGQSWLRLTLDEIKYDFRIADIQYLSNLAQKTIHGPSGAPIKVKINFTSDEFIFKNFEVIIDDFIGKISKNERGEEEEPDSNSYILPEYVDKITIPQELRDKEKGLVQFLMEQASNRTKKPLEAHDTFNDVCIKNSFSFYPFLKDANNLRVTQLLNYVCEYACYSKNPSAVNFFFWEDLEKWNFKCIEGLVEDSFEDLIDPNSENIKIYKPHLDEFSEDALLSLQVINDLDFNYLYDSGAAISTYDRIKPNWSNPYRSFISIKNAIINDTVNYNYTEDFKQWYDISGLKDNKKSIYRQEINFILNSRGQFQYDQDEDGNTVVSGGGDPENTPHGYTGKKLLAYDNYSWNKLVDNVFGYYSPPYNINKISAWQLKNFEHTIEKEYWQSQFDFCELPGAILKLVDEIKKEAAAESVNYIDLKDKKTMWDVYRKKMCCERPIPSSFFAVITGAEKIYGSTGSGSFTSEDPGGIWAYDWVEVEFWPQEKTKEKELELKTTTYDQDEDGNTVTNVSTETTTIPSKSNISEMLKVGYQIINFETETNDSSEFPFIFVQPPWALRGKVSEEVTKNNKTYKTKDNRAYNLNEILNSRIPEDFDNDTDIPTIIMNPGISTVLGDSVTVNAAGVQTAYPEKTQMLPVGKFRILSGHCPNFKNDGQEVPGDDSGQFYYAGRIVQMSAVPVETIQSIVIPGVNDTAIRRFSGLQPEKIEVDLYGVNEDGTDAGFMGTQEIANPDYKEEANRQYLFLFDVENAHDGLCSDCNQ